MESKSKTIKAEPSKFRKATADKSFFLEENKVVEYKNALENRHF